MKTEKNPVSEALVKAAERVYHKLPEMADISTDLQPEEIFSRLKRFFDGSEDFLATHFLLSRIVNISLKLLEPDLQLTLLKILKGVNNCQASQP